VKDKVHRWKQHGADLQGRERTGGGNWATTETVTETSIGDFDIEFNPDKVVVKPGSSKFSNLKITSKGYEGAITLTVKSCPSSWTCNLSSDMVNLLRTGKPVRLEFSVPSSAEEGTYTIIVSARDSLNHIKTASLIVEVRE
jgi:uncharacterized membrane protein